MSRRALSTTLALAALPLALAACEPEPVAPEPASPESGEAAAVAAVEVAAVRVAAGAGGPGGGPEPEGAVDGESADFSALDARLAEAGLAARLGVVEYLALGESGRVGRLVLASDRGNKQLVFDWVPDDPRRGGGTAITWVVDAVDAAATGLTAAATEAAVDRALATWTSVSCSSSDLALMKLGAPAADLGVVEFLLGLGGVPAVLADVTQAGWVPGPFFNSPPFFPPDGATFILGATFTAGFVDADGNFVDADGDGKLDAAFREIYYNNAFPWGIGTGFPIDVESVVLHETGHGLSQAHFGDIFLTPTGKLRFAPLAVMNAAYSGVQQALTGTDHAGHCSLWGSWPNR